MGECYASLVVQAVPWNPRKIGDYFKDCFEEGHSIGVRARYGGEVFPEPVVNIFCRREQLPAGLRGFWTRVPKDLHEAILDKGSAPLLRKFITVGVPPRERMSRAEGRTHHGGSLTKADKVLLGVLAALGVGTFAVLALFGRAEFGNDHETPSESA